MDDISYDLVSMPIADNLRLRALSFLVRRPIRRLIAFGLGTPFNGVSPPKRTSGRGMPLDSAILARLRFLD
jgi:hypothetical protein